jgi:hypothetical protein
MGGATISGVVPQVFICFPVQNKVWEMGFLRGPDQALTGTGVKVEVRP